MSLISTINERRNVYHLAALQVVNEMAAAYFYDTNNELEDIENISGLLEAYLDNLVYDVTAEYTELEEDMEDFPSVSEGCKECFGETNGHVIYVTLATMAAAVVGKDADTIELAATKVNAKGFFKK